MGEGGPGVVHGPGERLRVPRGRKARLASCGVARRPARGPACAPAEWAQWQSSARIVSGEAARHAGGVCGVVWQCACVLHRNMSGQHGGPGELYGAVLLRHGITWLFATQHVCGLAGTMARGGAHKAAAGWWRRPP